MFNILRAAFALAMSMFFVWIISLSYNKWFEPDGSVLDRYIEHAGHVSAKTVSFDGLVRSYDQTYRAVESYESNGNNPELSEAEKETTEPYRSEAALRNEIHEREMQAEEIFKVRYYWFCGLAFLICGVAIFKKLNKLLGLPFMFVGFSEMLVYTEPARYGRDSGALLTNKIVFAILSVILLIVTGYLINIMKEERDSS